jgi:hypothetical protein
MTKIGRFLARATPTPSTVAVDVFRTIALFSGVGLLVSLCAAIYGLDLSAGFF